MFGQNLEFWENSRGISREDPLISHLKEILAFIRHKNYLAKSYMGLLWLLSGFDLRVIASVAYSYLSSPNCLKLLHQLRNGDPGWEETLETLPEVTPGTPNLLIYIMSSFPSDIDGPLPLAGTRAAEKAGFSVDPTKRQIFGGAAVEGAKEINEALKEEDSKAMGKVLKPIILTKEGETATTGGGLEVYGKQLSQDYRLKIKISEEGELYIASSNSHKAHWGVVDDSPKALATALKNGAEKVGANKDSQVAFDPARCRPRAFAYVDGAPLIIANLMEALLIVGGQLATGSPRYVEAAESLGIEIPVDRPFEVRNEQIGVEDPLSPDSDDEPTDDEWTDEEWTDEDEDEEASSEIMDGRNENEAEDEGEKEKAQNGCCTLAQLRAWPLA